LLQVKAGDQVLHLRGIRPDAELVGFSIAELDGYVTDAAPPDPGDWAYASYYHRVPLKSFTSFPEPINLEDVFTRRDAPLRDYFHRNRLLSDNAKLRLFYVIQAGRLQCLNGAYLSEVDRELAGIILGSQFSHPVELEHTVIQVSTDEVIRQLSTRVGQSDFSTEVRENYDHNCCFPDCKIEEDKFLVGAHIARWADAPELRGKVSNGLCLCLMHDKAFEAGFFTISEDYTVVVNRERAETSAWCRESILPYEGVTIRLAEIPPSEDALLHHWIRTKFY
jgi:hypothetical protein